MAKRIKKSEWTEFLHGFSARNQFRVVELEGNAIPKQVRDTQVLYFLGVRYVKESSREEAEAYVTKASDPGIGFSVGSLKSPKSVTLTQSSSGGDIRLTVSAAGDKKMKITLRNDISGEVRRGVMAKIAYALFEKEGQVHGRDFEHWGEAERIIRDLDRMVTERFI